MIVDSHDVASPWGPVRRTSSQPTRFVNSLDGQDDPTLRVTYCGNVSSVDSTRPMARWVVGGRRGAISPRKHGLSPCASALVACPWRPRLAGKHRPTTVMQHTCGMTAVGRTDTFRRRCKRRQWPLQAFKKNVRSKKRFRLYSGGRRGDSAHHAVDDGRRPFWFVAVRWPRQAGMTLLTRRPLPSDRRPMPSCL